ncbi:hypothetical protein KC19_5G002200 [Ceratodon purpureus]|uniref:protein disulfide-isomerase n=1 Tax=Ceratodon purpureus TaxID=3225 RepID=A0A8T0HWB5_CERPU|nr:hypothetical protein KC19_5G002200 [Ceratodon purpureus]
MAQRWFGFLLLLLVVLSVSIHCCHSIQEDHSHTLVNEDQVPSEDDDDLEDLEEGMDLDAQIASDSFSSAEALAATKVANVNDKDVERVIEKFEFVLLLGYAPWCTQSEELLPEFTAAALRLSQLGNPVLLAKLDAVNNPSAAAQYEIQGFPTLVFFVNGTREQYLGGYSREEIVRWVRKKTGHAVTTITSKEEAESFLSKNVTAVLGYFETLEGPEHDAFIAAAKAEAETEFVQMTVAEVAQIFAESSILPPLIAVRKQEPEHFTTFRGSFSIEEIASFVEINKHPLLTVLNSKNANMVYGSPMKLHVLLFAEKMDYENVRSLYLEAAKDFKGKVMFLVIDMEDQEFSRPMLAVYGLDTNKPVVAGLNNEDGARYFLESDFTVDNLKTFAANMYAGRLPVYYKSEPVPAEVHAPWCATCEKVGRVFEKLAKHVQDVPSLVMAKCDGQENEHPLLLEVPNYPSLLLYPAGRKSSSPIEAESKATWKKLLIFLKENVAIPFPVSNDDEVFSNAASRRETAELDTLINDEL